MIWRGVSAAWGLFKIELNAGNKNSIETCDLAVSLVLKEELWDGQMLDVYLRAVFCSAS